MRDTYARYSIGFAPRDTIAHTWAATASFRRFDALSDTQTEAGSHCQPSATMAHIKRPARNVKPGGEPSIHPHASGSRVSLAHAEAAALSLAIPSPDAHGRSKPRDARGSRNTAIRWQATAPS
jgi:hypothetical protein